MEVASPSEPGANGVAVAPFPSVDPAQVVEHLASVCEVVLGATKEDLEAPGSLLHISRHADTIQRCTRFATDTQTTLYIQKDVLPSSTAQAGEEESSMFARRRRAIRSRWTDLDPCRASVIHVLVDPRDLLRTHDHLEPHPHETAPAHRPQHPLDFANNSY